MRHVATGCIPDELYFRTYNEAGSCRLNTRGVYPYEAGSCRLNSRGVYTYEAGSCRLNSWGVDTYDTGSCRLNSRRSIHL
jgi:hypothetical protein